MSQRFAVGDRVIVIDAQAARVPRGNVGTVVRIFVRLPEMCDVQFDTYTGPLLVLVDALAPAPTSDATEPAGASSSGPPT
jgi:hypothetical protein